MGNLTLLKDGYQLCCECGELFVEGCYMLFNRSHGTYCCVDCFKSGKPIKKWRKTEALEKRKESGMEKDTTAKFAGYAVLRRHDVPAYESAVGQGLRS